MDNIRVRVLEGRNIFSKDNVIYLRANEEVNRNKILEVIQIYKMIEKKAEITNLEDATMFLMACSASDNCFKNSYYAANVSKPGEYVMTWCPWDLDFTFGNMCDTEIKDISIFNDDYMAIYQNNELAKLMITDRSEIGDDFWMRWKEYRKSFLSTDSITGLLKKIEII